MIYVEPRAGLCNRMRVIASAYHLAQQYNTDVTILWRISKGLCCSYSDLFEQESNIKLMETKYKISIKFILKALTCNRIFIDCKHDRLAEIEKALKENKKIYITSVHPFYDVGHFEMFKPIPHIGECISDICERFTSNTIGIHIRRTDNIEAIKHSPLSLFLDFINREIMKDQNVRFYLATDSEQVAKEIIDRYGEYIIVNKNKILGRDSKQGMENALIDLGCLAKCKHIAGSYYSSFSETAASWGNINLSILSDVDKVN